MGLRCNGSMFVHLPFFFCTPRDSGDELLDTRCSPFHLSPLLKSTSQKKLVDQATLPCHSSSPDSKHDQRLDSNSLAYGATRLEICTYVFVLVLFRFVFYCASRQSVVAHVQIVTLYSRIDSSYCTSVQGNILLLEKRTHRKKNIGKHSNLHALPSDVPHSR